MRKLINSIKKFIEKIRYYFSHKCCYDDRERQGKAVFGMCGGVVGGDFNNGYLNYDCMDCPYLIRGE